MIPVTDKSSGSLHPSMFQTKFIEIVFDYDRVNQKLKWTYCSSEAATYEKCGLGTNWYSQEKRIEIINNYKSLI